MKNVKAYLQFWCFDGFNCADCCCVTDLSVQMDLTIPAFIMIDLESRIVYALWLSNLRRIFSTVSTNFHHMEKYHKLSLPCSYRLMTSYLCMVIIFVWTL